MQSESMSAAKPFLLRVYFISSGDRASNSSEIIASSMSYSHHFIKTWELKFRFSGVFHVTHQQVKLQPKLSRSEHPHLTKFMLCWHHTQFPKEASGRRTESLASGDSMQIQPQEK